MRPEVGATPPSAHCVQCGEAKREYPGDDLGPGLPAVVRGIVPAFFPEIVKAPDEADRSYRRQYGRSIFHLSVFRCAPPRMRLPYQSPWVVRRSPDFPTWKSISDLALRLASHFSRLRSSFSRP